MTQFPTLNLPPQEITDTGTLRLGSGCITGKLPARKAAPIKALFVGASLLALGACSAQQQQDASALIAQGCAKFRQAEANPLVQLAVAGGTMAANIETGGAAGPIVSTIKSFGDNYCQAGPPVGDTSTPVQQASWLAGVTAKLLGAAGAK